MAVWPSGNDKTSRSCRLGLKDIILWVLSHINAYTELSVGPISIVVFLVK